MKVVHFVPALSKGGGERVTVDLANEAARRGHEVWVVAAVRVDETLLRDALLPSVNVVYATNGGGRFALYPKTLSWMVRNWRWLQNTNIIHCHMTISSVVGTFAYFLGRLSSIRPAIVETYHAVGMPIPRWHRWFHARLASRRDAVALMAEDPFWRAFANVHRRVAVRTIPNGVAVEQDGPPTPQQRLAYRRSVGIPDACPIVVGTVGRLDPARRPCVYPKIFGRIAHHFPEAHFLMGGAGPELGRVEAAIAEEGLTGRVHLPGLVLEPRLAFSIMDLYLTLNVGPITGVAGIEAAFAGLPILGIQLIESYRGDDDWIWSSENPNEIGERAIALLCARPDLRAMAERQQAHAKAHHTVEAMADAYDSLYQAALANALSAR